MAKVQVSAENRDRLKKLAALVARLPPLDRQLWDARIRARLRKGPTVVAGEFGLEKADDGSEAKVLQFREWDLELANWLDGAYNTVADRAAEVAKKGTDAVSQLGFSMWPLAIAAAVVLFAMGSAKGR